MNWVPNSRLVRGLGLLGLLLLLLVSGAAVWHVTRPHRPAWVDFLESKTPVIPPAPSSSASAPHGDLYSVTYDVRDLVDFNARPVSAANRGKKNGPRDIDELATMIVQVVTGPWGGTRNNSTIDEINGTHLEIHTTHRRHQEIADLLEALRRLDDLAVMLESQLYEVDRDFYEQVVEPELSRAPLIQGKRCGSVISGPPLEQIVTQGSKIKHGTALVVPNGETVRLASLRRVLTGSAYVPGKPTTPAPPPLAEEAAKNLAWAGVTVKGTIVVTADRRYVRLVLEQEITEPAGTTQQKMPDPLTDSPVVIEQPNVVRSSFRATIQVADGETALLPIHYHPNPGGKRVLLLVVQPTIYIEAEDKMRQQLDRELPNPRDWLKKLLAP
jgi:hypothetical protein